MHTCARVPLWRLQLCQPLTYAVLQARAPAPFPQIPPKPHTGPAAPHPPRHLHNPYFASTPFPSSPPTHRPTPACMQVWHWRACDSVSPQLAGMKQLHGVFASRLQFRSRRGLLPVFSAFKVPGCFAGGCSCVWCLVSAGSPWCAPSSNSSTCRAGLGAAHLPPATSCLHVGEQAQLCCMCSQAGVKPVSAAPTPRLQTSSSPGRKTTRRSWTPPPAAPPAP